MLKTLLRQLLVIFAPSVVDEFVREGQVLQKKKELRERDEFLCQTYDTLRSTAVISVDGLYGNIVVGFVTGTTRIGLTNVPLPIVQDYVTLTTAICYGPIMVFTQERLEALCKLTPRERWILVNHTTHPALEEVEVAYSDRDKVQEPLTGAQLKSRLMDNSFFDHLNQQPQRS